jgi:hypothetical protein
MTILRLTLAALLTFNVQAEWYSGSGTAVIFDDNRQLARQQAAKQALRNVLLQGDVSLAALQLYRQEDLAEELFALHSSVPVSQIVILEEHERDGQLSITLKADVWPQANLCDDRSIAKALVLTPFSLSAGATQVALGNNALNTEINRRFTTAVQRSPADFLVKAITAEPLFAPEQYQQGPAQQQLRNMAESAQAQFIVAGRLRNLSFGRQQAGLLKKERWVRQFSLEVSVLDGVSGRQIQSQIYQTRTLWPFAMTTELDPASDQLWRSDFGIELQRLINEAVDDIAVALSCVRIKAQVIRVAGSSITISAGSRQGIKPGDTFSLLHSDSFTDSWGNSYAVTAENDSQLEVVRVYPDHAETRAVKSHYLAPVQVRDQVQLDSVRERQYAN